MKTQVALALAVVACLQVVQAGSFFENVEPQSSPKLPIDPIWTATPIKDIFEKVDSSLPRPHIVGGREASPHSHPHQVALRLRSDIREAFCGGSLISEQWVLTAGHCAYGMDSITAVLGAHNITIDEPTVQYVDVSRVVIHPQYNENTVRNDIALLQLSDSVTLDDGYVSTIRLPSLSQRSESFWRREATMSGWGKDRDGSDTVSPVLREVNSVVVSNFYCSFRYFFNLVHDTNICTDGGFWRRHGTCNGDSGGPLIVTEADGERTLVGITSFGIALGCEKSWPPVFTRVTSYLDWIHTTTGIEPRL